MDRLRLDLGEVDLVRRELTGPDGVVRLTTQDAAVLRYLAERAGSTVAREDLERDVWGLADGVRSEAVPVAMRRLRARIERDPAAPRNLQTVYGVGWVLHPSEEAGLPAERDPFVGRTEQLATLADLWASGVRAVQLAGPGGIGKTRLARRAAATFQGTVRLVELTSVSGPDELVRAMAEGWGVPLARSEPTEQVGAALSTRGTTLTLLDAAEGVLAELESTVGRWLEAAPRASFLITTRRPGRLEGSVSVTVGPLHPEAGVRLLRLRAPSASADPAELRALVEDLDGLPLALELAAARLGAVSVPELLQLAPDPEDPRLRDEARSVRVALRETWEGLSLVERDVLSQLTLFARSFTRADADAVVDPGPGHTTASVLERLTRVGALVPRGPRWGLLRPLRRLAAAPLDPAARRAAEVRHGRWAIRRSSDLDEIQSAVGRAVERGDAEVARDAALAAWALIVVRGPLALGVALLELALPLCPGDVDLLLALAAAVGRAGDTARERELAEQALAVARGPAQQARALNRRGWADLRTADIEQAGPPLEQALSLARAAGDLELEATVLSNLASVDDLRGAPRMALERYDQALVTFAACSPTEEAVTRVKLGLLHARLFEVPDAMFQYQRALECFEALDHDLGRAIARTNLAQLVATHGDPDVAVAELQEALALHRGLGHRVGVAAAHGSLALHAVELGRPRIAHPHLDAALRLHRELGDRRLEALALGWQASLALLEGRVSTAERHLDRAVRLVRTVAAPRSRALLASPLADLALARGQALDALEHLDAAVADAREGGVSWLVSTLEVERGRALLALGREAQARAAVEAALPSLRQGPRELAQARCVLAEILIAGGEGETAHRLAEEARAVQLAQQIGPISPLGAALARLERP